MATLLNMKLRDYGASAGNDGSEGEGSSDDHSDRSAGASPIM